MRESFILKSMLLALIGTASACSNLGQPDKQQVSELARLTTAMDQCLANQTGNQQQLAGQSEQLEQVMTALETMAQEKHQPEPRSASAPIATTPNCPPPVADEFSKIVIGEREQVWLQDLQLALPARIDTGAETASLDARNIELFERNSKNWVRFEINHPETQEPLQLERKLERTALILQASNSEAERRPVIKLGITLGPVSQSAEFTLSNRSHLDYQILVGRNILRDVMIVDVSKEYLLPPTEPVPGPANQAAKASTP